MFIDTHSHLYLGKLADHIPEAIANLQAAGFSHSIQIGTSLETSAICLELCRSYPMLRATVGIHPCEAQDMPLSDLPQVLEDLENLIIRGKEAKSLVGFGEIGLDHYHLSEDEERAGEQKACQIAWFRVQAELAKKYDLPVVIHTRHCPDWTLRELRDSGLTRFVIHCFSENWDFAREILDLSDESMISFTGIVTFPQADTVQSVARLCPLDRIMIETDAPYIIPAQMRGKAKYCEPAFSRYVYESLCQIRSEDPDVIRDTLYANTLKFFGI